MYFTLCNIKLNTNLAHNAIDIIVLIKILTNSLFIKLYILWTHLMLYNNICNSRIMHDILKSSLPTFYTKNLSIMPKTHALFKVRCICINLTNAF